MGAGRRLRPIWLIGMMGSGKSTIAPLVAAELGREWVDTDDMVEQATDRTIPDLFAESEERFRSEELAVINSLTDLGVVVAAGGGAVTTEAAAVMRSTGFVVWLRASVATLLDRIADPGARPLLAGDPAAALERIARARERQYAAAADVWVDTDGRKPAEVAREVVSAWLNAPSAE